MCYFLVANIVKKKKKKKSIENLHYSLQTLYVCLDKEIKKLTLFSM